MDLATSSTFRIVSDHGPCLDELNYLRKYHLKIFCIFLVKTVDHVCFSCTPIAFDLYKQRVAFWVQILIKIYAVIGTVTKYNSCSTF